MRNKNATKPEFSSEYIWKGIAIFAIFYIFHTFIYGVSISESTEIQSLVKEISSYTRTIVIRPGSYEYLGRPFHIPYMQMAAGLFISTPLSVVACGPISRYTMQLYGVDEKSAFDLKLISAIGVLGATSLFFLPPSPFGGKLFSSHFGLISPFRYSISVFGFGYFLRLFFAKNQQREQNAGK